LPNPNSPTDSEEAAGSDNTQSSRLTLEDAVHLGELSHDPCDCLRNGVEAVTMMVDSTNAANLRFDSHTGLPAAFVDAVDNRHGAAFLGSTSDIRNALVKQGCDAKLLRDNWISNHTRWVVWKRASYERSFSRFLGGRHLTYESLVKNLKRRFEKEIVEGRRPAIRKVLNRDAAASRMMILAVAQVLPLTQTSCETPSNNESQTVLPHVKIELTDGWYSIQAILDPKLSEFVQRGLIKVGSKLLTSNAQLIGADEGIDPLDGGHNPSDPGCKIGLRLTANATRLGKWNAKLGYLKLPMSAAPKGSLLVRKISDIIPGGGNIPTMQLVVSRRYPLLYYEKTQTKEDDAMNRSIRSPILTEAEEDLRRMHFEKRTLKAVEKLTEHLERDLEKVRLGTTILHCCANPI
jgi:breast cancer 2 susceptibility protein